MRSAKMQNNPLNTRKNPEYAEIELELQPVLKSRENNLVINETTDAYLSNSGTHLRLSAVVNEGKGALALTEVTSAKNHLAVSVNIAPPGIKMLDKADRDFQSASHSLSPVFMGKDGEGEEISRKDPDFTFTARPVAQSQTSPFQLSLHFFNRE